MARSSIRNGKSGPLCYHACAAGPDLPKKRRPETSRLPEVVIYDHIGFKGAYARTNLSFHFLGDFWNDRMNRVLISRDDYYKGDHWDLGPGFYECFFTDAGPDDVVSSFQAISLT